MHLVLVTGPCCPRTFDRSTKVLAQRAQSDSFSFILATEEREGGPRHVRHVLAGCYVMSSEVMQRQGQRRPGKGKEGGGGECKGYTWLVAMSRAVKVMPR